MWCHAEGKFHFLFQLQQLMRARQDVDTVGRIFVRDERVQYLPKPIDSYSTKKLFKHYDKSTLLVFFTCLYTRFRVWDLPWYKVEQMNSRTVVLSCDNSTLLSSYINNGQPKTISMSPMPVLRLDSTDCTNCIKGGANIKLSR